MATTATRKPDLVIRGRKVVGGVVEGEALATTQTISGWGGVNPMKGEVIESRHELRGVSFAGKILVFPGAKGSSGWSAVFHTSKLAGASPGGYRLFTGGAAKHHACVLVGEVIDIADGLVGLRAGVLAEQR